MEVTLTLRQGDKNRCCIYTEDRVSELPHKSPQTTGACDCQGKTLAHS